MTTELFNIINTTTGIILCSGLTQDEAEEMKQEYINLDIFNSNKEIYKIIKS
jgi:hypothetical protein